MNTPVDWTGLLPGERISVGDAEVEVAGLVIGAGGVYVLLTVDTPFREGWQFQFDCNHTAISGTVDYCEEKDGKYLLGVEIQRLPEPLALAC